MVVRVNVDVVGVASLVIGTLGSSSLLIAIFLFAHVHAIADSVATVTAPTTVVVKVSGARAVDRAQDGCSSVP